MSDDRPKKGVRLMGVTVTLNVSHKVAFWMRQEWPRDTAKCAALAFGTTRNTTKAWLAGVRPDGTFFDMMVARWGKPFIAHVYAPFDWAQQLALDVELETALASLEEIRDRLRSRNEPTQNVGGEVLPMANEPAAETRSSVARADHKIDRSAS